MIRVVINGILGKMGREISNAVSTEPDIEIVGGVARQETALTARIPVKSKPEQLLRVADVVIDFSSGEGTANIARACQEAKKPLITGTTALTEEQKSTLIELSRKVPVVQSYNFSIGINILVNLLKVTVDALGKSFDVEIIDVHHRQKKDAPSGTSILLAEALAQAMGFSLKNILQLGRSGNNLERGNEIVIHSLRGGSVVGEHQIHFFCGNEDITITHRALSRMVFVDGVIRATRWIVSQKPGYYTMQDVLNLKKT